MTFQVHPDELLVGDSYKSPDGKVRQIVQIDFAESRLHGQFWQVVWKDHSLCGVEVFRPDDLLEVVQNFETKE